jgi:MFS family permease
MPEAASRLAAPLRAFTTVFRNPDVRRLQIAWAGVSFSLWAFAIALGVYAFEVGGAALVGIAGVVRLAPGVLASPVAGLLGDRHSRSLVLVVSAVGSGVAIAVAAAAAAMGAPAAIVLAMAGVFTVANCLYIPAEGALLPLVARTPQELSAANVIHSIMDNAGFLVGSLATALVLAIANPEAVFAIAAAVSLLSAGVLLRVRRDERPEYAVDISSSGLARETLAGLREIARNPELRLSATALTLLVFVEGAADVLAVLIALELLGLGEEVVGLLSAAWGIGAIAGGVARATFGLPAIWPEAPGAYVAFLGIGLGYTFVEVAGHTLLLRLGADETLGRVLASLETVRYAAMALGSIVVPLIVAFAGVRGAVAVTAVVMPVFALLAWGSLRRLDAGAPLEERGYSLLREDPIFAPLPVATLERLGHALQPVEASAGDRIIEEGDHGDRFFVIDSGEVEVLEGDVSRRRQGPGTSFGEIALLHDVPRTATVRALEPTRLLALERESFLKAVTGQHRSREAAGGVMHERLEDSSAEHLREAADEEQR